MTAPATHFDGSISQGSAPRAAAEPLLRLAPLILFVGIFVTFSALSPAFRTAGNVKNILVQSSSVAIAATGMTLVLLTGGIDLSVGAIMFLSAAVAGKLVVGGWVPGLPPVPVWLAVLAILPVGLLFGAVNAVLIAGCGMLPFVVTLATLFIGRGVALQITQTRALNLPPEFLSIGHATLMGVPFPVVLLAFTVGAAHIVLTQTPFGRQLYALGNSPDAARKAGLRTTGLVAAVYLASAACAALAGIVSVAQLGAVSPTFGWQREFAAVAAAVLGGTSLFGGRGSVLPGTLLGALTIQTVETGLNIIDADPYSYPVVVGAIIFTAVLTDRLRGQSDYVALYDQGPPPPLRLTRGCGTGNISAGRALWGSAGLTSSPRPKGARMKRTILSVTLAVFALSLTPSARAEDLTAGMKEGKPGLKSMGPIAFGPDGVLFIADAKSAVIVAVATGDTKAAAAGAKPVKVESVDRRVAALLGTSPDAVLINDVAVNPISRHVYLAVSRGRGPDAVPVLLRVDGAGTIEPVSLDRVKFSRAELPDAPVDGVVGEGRRQSNPRQESITDVAFFQDRVIVAGLSNEEFASTLRAVPFPFKTVAGGTSVEIYHGAHGRFETRAPVRTLVPVNVGDEPYVLAAYTCTPLVQIPVKALEPKAKVRGKTIAELGNRNRPLDMVVYEKGGDEYLLIANSSRGVMRINADNIEEADSIEEPVQGGGQKGLNVQAVEGWTGVEHLDLFDDNHALVLRRPDGEKGAASLETLPLP